MLRRLALVIGLAAAARGQSPAARPIGVLSIDLTRASPEVAPPLPGLGGRSPNGTTIGTTARYLTFNGQPWFPVAGEFASVRSPATTWALELRKIKAAKVSLIEVPVIWNFQETAEGRFDWTGDRDLGAFIRLCAAEGLPVILRLGTGGEADVRRGGLPPWVETSDSAAYLKAVSGFYDSLGAQMKGLLWKDGGPVLGLEFQSVGSPDQWHVLKHAALAAGLETPLYFTDSVNPPPSLGGEFLPIGRVAADSNRFDSSADPTPEGDRAYLFSAGNDPARFTTALGTGLIPSYRRRATLSGADLAAETLVALGSGANLPIYRPFHGGFNPAANLNATRATGSPADLPIFNASAIAPISAVGDFRPAYPLLRSLDLFVADFGASLALTKTWLPDRLPQGATDTKVVRWAVRTSGEAGFLFINNYRRTDPLPARPSLQFELRYRDHTQLVPVGPITLPAQTQQIWPLNLQMGRIKLIYATAQPVCRLGSWFVFAALPNLPPDFLFDKTTLAADSSAHLGGMQPGLDCTFTVTGTNGVAVHVLILTAEQATLASKFRLEGRDHLVLGNVMVQAGEGLSVTLAPRQSTSLLVFPKLGLGRPGADSGIFSSFPIPAGPARETLESGDTNPLAPYAVQSDAHGIVIPPSDADYDHGQIIKVRVPIALLDPGANSVLYVAYVGDAARAYVGDRLIADSFYDGSDWKIPVAPFLPQIIDQGLTIKVVPFEATAKIYVTPGLAPWFGSESTTIKVRYRVSAEETKTLDLVPAESGK